MNPQYIQQGQQPPQQSQPQQQQTPYYTGAQGVLPYGPPNANMPSNQFNGPQAPSMYPPQKQHPLPGDMPSPPQSQYYANNSQGPPMNLQSGPGISNTTHVAPSPTNQNNLVNQMANMSMGGLQRPPSGQGFPPPAGKANQLPSPPSNINGFNGNPDNMPHGTDSAGQTQASGLPPAKPGATNFGKLSHPAAPGAPIQTDHSVSQLSTVPFTGGGPPSQVSGPPGQKFPGQPPLPAPVSQPGQHLPGTTRLSGPPLPGQHNVSGSLLTGQRNLSGPPLPGQQNLSNSSLPGQQNLSGQPLAGQQSLSGPPLPGQQNLSGPPVPGQQKLSGPILPGQQNVFGQPLPGQQNISGPSLPGQQNVFGQPLPGQQNLSGPPLPGQQHSSGSQIQPHLAGPPHGPGQAHMTSPSGPGQPPMSGGQMSGQRQYMSGPPVPGQPPMGISRQSPGNLPPYQQAGYQQQGFHGQTRNFQGGITGPAGAGYQPEMQPQQVRRLDPDQMPSPIQVMQDDQRVRGGVFVTNQKGLVPPLVTTQFTTQDQGNASPRFIRSTMYTVPTTTDIMKQTNVPFGLVISPMARVEEGEFEPPVVDMGELGPVRCIRCKAYMCPFMQFIDSGRRFQCMFCKATTEVPAEYFQHLDHTGQRMDRFERPELMLGTFEYIATKDYCTNNVFPKPPAFVFVIDVSYNTVKSGLINLLCSEMKNIIRNLPVDAGQTKSNMKVGFITYNNTVHFYNVKACLAQPQMMVVGDVQEVFMPLLDGFLCDVEESEAVIDSLMAQIPVMFADTRETEILLAPAIQAGLEALKASDCAGKLMVFHSSLPIAEAPGKLKNRDDRKVLGTEKEKTVLAPQNNVYNNLGQECVSAGCSVDLFIFNNSYVDIATIGQVARLTGGEVFKYTYFQADIDGERLITDIIDNISKPIAFNAVMRVRTSTGVRATDFYGHFFMSNTTDMELASIDCNKAVAIEIKHDDKLTDEEGVYVQVALLYTSCGGVRRLRIINLSLSTSSQMSELYRACDLDAIVNFFSKQSVFKLIESTPKTVKDNLIARCASMLAAYRKHCAAPSSAGQLILPECMKLLPLYVNCILKSDAISGGADMTIDDRSYVMQAVATMPIHTSVAYFYPRLIPLHDIDPQGTDLPQMLRCSIDKFAEDGAYLLENGIHMFLWLGLGLSSQWVQGVFGVPSVVQVDVDRTQLPQLDNPLSKRISDIVSHIRAQRHRCMRLTIVRQREKLEMVLRHFLAEDRSNDGSPSYVDFLCHMHKEIRGLLS
ncbi:protein transport protein Sec24C isoform X2 [Cephus cinctus]|uniref:Protein transport protein Sec24C isoform X2 n=1 Tax=Cephus cinctus TaxID=211228 RepID=A0AAJ7FSS3_CEPCN|nr:protein transport protein Sec24C isoform X2 [Cephus cinctus]